MSSYSVDSNGDRIKTDILVSGYVKEFVAQHEIQVPDEIIGVLFMFWFIDVCDQWDMSLCHESVVIGGPCVTLNKGTDYQYRTIFGTKCVRAGYYSWIIKFNTDIRWFLVGIIKNDIKILENNQLQNVVSYLLNRNGVVLGGNGVLYRNGAQNQSYCDRFGITNKDTSINMTLDMANKTINYKINDKQYETKSIQAANAYRLVVAISWEDGGLQLL